MSLLRLLAPFVPLLLAILLFVPGINWGLPTRNSDRYLFGNRTPWTGAQILALLSSPTTRPSDSPLGADVDANPILDRSRPHILNDTDAKRAEIVQRYRLMSRQPDEFIQFKALAEMATRPGVHKLDPRLYQYGGLWIYPVGGLLVACDRLGLVTLRADRAFYLNHPEEFGKFYIVARAYSVFWGLVAVGSIFWIAKRVTSNTIIACLAACGFAALPVVTTAAHEAKPHLAGGALVLLAVIAATMHFEARKKRYALLAGILCGAAPGMVLSMVWAVTLLPVMLMISWHGRPIRERTAGGTPVPRLILLLGVSGATYALTNPFVLWNALFHREYLQSNLGNSTAMYGVRDLPRALADATQIFMLGATSLVLIGGVAGVVMLMWSALRRVRANAPTIDSEARTLERNLTPLMLLAGPALLTLLTFIALAAGKQTEYARFSLLVAAAAVLLFAFAVGACDWQRVKRSPGQSCLAAVLVAASVWFLIVWNIARIESDYRTAETTQSYWFANSSTSPAPQRGRRVGTWYEPAPWSTPPLYLFGPDIVLLSHGLSPAEVCDVVIYPRQLLGEVLGKSTFGPLSWQREAFAIQSLQPSPANASTNQ